MFTVIFLLLAIKHFVADLYLQAVYIRPSLKWIYLDSKSHQHYAHHAVFTAVIFGVAWAWWWLAAVMFVVDYVTHWHVDYSKTCIARHLGWTELTHARGHWLLQTVDQCIHFVIYFGMVWCVVRFI